MWRIIKWKKRYKKNQLEEEQILVLVANYIILTNLFSGMALPDLRSLDKSLEVQTMTTKVKKSVTNSNFEIPRR